MNQPTKPRHRWLLAIFLCPILFTSGCGYILSGEWKDDPKNWNRAFGGTMPDGVTAHHSFYARMPHFTKEWTYYFELEDCKAAREAIGAQSFLKPSKRTLSELHLESSRPDWFLKAAPKHVEIYEYPGADEFFAVIDLDSGRIFLHDAQF